MWPIEGSPTFSQHPSSGPTAIVGGGSFAESVRLGAHLAAILILATRDVARHFIAHLVERLMGSRPEKVGDQVGAGSK